MSEFPKRLNMRDILLPRQESVERSEEPFNPKLDLPPAFWQPRLESLEKGEMPTGGWDSLRLAEEMQTLNPQVRLPSLPPNFYSSARGFMDMQRQDTDLRRWFRVLHVAVPVKFNGMNPLITEENWKECIRLRQTHREEKRWHDYLWLASDMKLFRPHESDTLSEEEWNEISEFLIRESSPSSLPLRAIVNWNNVCAELSLIKLIDASRMPEVPPEGWKQLKSGFENWLVNEKKSRADRGVAFFDTLTTGAWELAIIAAEKVNITEQGVRLEYAPPHIHSEPVPPLPEESRLPTGTR